MKNYDEYFIVLIALMAGIIIQFKLPFSEHIMDFFGISVVSASNELNTGLILFFFIAIGFIGNTLLDLIQKIKIIPLIWFGFWNGIATNWLIWDLSGAQETTMSERVGILFVGPLLVGAVLTSIYVKRKKKEKNIEL